MLEAFVLGIEFLDDHLIELVIFVFLVGLGLVYDLFNIIPNAFLDILYEKWDYAYVYSDGVVEEGMEFVAFGERKKTFLNLIFLVVKSLPSLIYVRDYVG